MVLERQTCHEDKEMDHNRVFSLNASCTARWIASCSFGALVAKVPNSRSHNDRLTVNMTRFRNFSATTTFIRPSRASNTPSISVVSIRSEALGNGMAL